MTAYQDDQLTIFQSALYQTNTTLFDAGSFILLVDPNWLLHEVHFIRDHVKKYHTGKPIYLLFTHSDYDHIIAYGLFPNAKVIASERFHTQTNRAQILKEIHDFDQQYYIQRDYPITYPEVDLIVDQEGMSLAIENEKFYFYFAPGHTADGLFTIIESQGIFIAGDYLSDLEFPFIYQSSTDYEQTLHKVDQILQQHEIRILIPGHGTYLKDENAEIIKRKNRDLKYIQDMKASLLNGSDFPDRQWLDLFPFPDGLQKQHEKNKQHFIRELKMKN